MKKSAPILLLLLFNFFFATSQENIVVKNYRNTISIDPAAALLRVVSISYAHKFGKSTELIFNPRYQPMLSKKTTILWNSVHDPFWLYENISLNIGVRKIFKNSMYVEPLVILKYGTYNNIRYPKYIDEEGDEYDEDDVISSRHKMIGGIVKGGWLYEENHFRLNLFWGVGYRFNNIVDVVHARYDWGGQLIYDHYPESRTINKKFFTIHFGVEVGLKW